MGDRDTALERPEPESEHGRRGGHAARGSFLGRRGGRWLAPLSALGLVVLGVNVIVVASAGAAIVTSQASLVDGQLTIVGSGALPNSTVTVDDGEPTGQADGKGDFSISASSFSEPSCVATLFDGSVSVEVSLSACTPTISPPFRVPAPPSPVGPSAGAQVVEPVNLSWQPPATPRGVSFRWQLSTRRSFASVVSTATVGPKKTSTTLSGLAPGTYYWRVQSVRFPPDPYFPLFGPWTHWDSLTITGEAAGTPGSPTVEAPAAGSEYHPDESYPIDWTTATGAASYRLQLAPNATFAPGTLLVDVPESGTEAHAPLMQFQTPLYIRVFGVNASGVRGLPSPTVPIRLTYKAPVPPAPRLLAPPSGATVKLPVTLRWTPDPNPQTEGYQLEINTTPNFSAGCGDIEECVSGLSQPRDTLFSLPAGVQYWRVQSFHGLAGPGTPAATAWSTVRNFTVSNAPAHLESLTIDVYTEGGVVLRSHTNVFSGTNEDNEAFGIVQLTTPAPAGGATVALASSDPKSAEVPPSIPIPAGQTQGTFTIQPLQVVRPVVLTLSATLGGHDVTAPLTVDPARLNQVYIESNQRLDGKYVPNFFSGGTDVVGNLLFNGNAPNGSVVTLASSSPAASVPASVSAAGQGVSFTITTRQVSTSTPVVLTATWRDKTVSVKLTLQPPPALMTPAPGVSFATGRVVVFRWHTPAGLSSQLQVADNPGFTNPIADFDTDTSQAWALTSLPSGTLYWRVLGVDIYGIEGPPPTACTFTVRPPTGPLPAPILEFPANGATVTAGQQVSFFWQPVNGAASYEITGGDVGHLQPATAHPQDRERQPGQHQQTPGRNAVLASTRNRLQRPRHVVNHVPTHCHIELSRRRLPLIGLFGSVPNGARRELLARGSHVEPDQG